MRIEWCKARARAHRWQEECALLMEEMRRILAFLRWQSTWWGLKAAVSADEGAKAYALRQAMVRTAMVTVFSQAWADVSSYTALGAGSSETGQFEHIEFDTSTTD